MDNYNFQANFSQFNHQTTQYNGENALLLADCAKLAYHPEDVIKQAMQEQLGFKNFAFFNIQKSTQGYVAGNDNIIIVAFRGTEKKLRDFLSDAKLALKPGPIGQVHHGFKDALDEVWENPGANSEMSRFILQCQNNNQSIWFCGHSLGAALTTLAAADFVIRQNHSIVGGIYTIGQPRVGNRTFSVGFDAALKNKCFRIVNNNDLVTRIPLPGFLLKYQHVGTEMYIDNRGNIQGELPWWRKIMDQFAGIKNDLLDLGIDSLKDHSSDDYTNILANEANRSISH